MSVQGGPAGRSPPVKDDDHAPDPGNHSARRSAGARSSTRRGRSSGRNGCRSADATGRVIAASPTAAMDVPPFDRAAMDGYAVRAEDTFGAGRYDPKTLRSLEKVFTGQVADAADRRRRMRGDRDRRADAPGRRRGRDGRRNRARRRRRPSPDLHAGLSATERRAAAAATSRQGQAALADRRRADAEPPRRAGRGRRDRRRGLRAAADRDPLDRQRDRRARTAARARADLRHQPLHARRRSSARTAACPWCCRPRRTRSRRCRMRSTRRWREDVLVFSGGSSVGERDLIMDVLVSRGEVIFHGDRGQARQADGARAASAASRCWACRATRRRACRTATCCSCRCCGGWRACRHSCRSACACRWRGASSRRPAATSSIRSASSTARAVPAFKASGDITSMSHADGYIEIPAQVDIVEAGELVDVKLF